MKLTNKGAAPRTYSAKDKNGSVDNVTIMPGQTVEADFIDTPMLKGAIDEGLLVDEGGAKSGSRKEEKATDGQV